MTLIDLGEVGHDDGDADPPAPAPRWLRRLGVPARGKALAAAAVAVLAGTLAGPLPFPEPPVHTIAAVELDGSAWVVDGIVIQTQGSSATAIDLATGRALWSRSWDQNVWRMDPFRGGASTILVVQDSPDPGFDPDKGQTEMLRSLAATGTISALDPRTGKEIWHRAGTLLNPVDSRRLVALRADPQPGHQAGSQWRISALDPGDGHDLWNMPMPESVKYTFVYDDSSAAVTGDMIMMDARDGSVTSIDAQGHQRALGRIAPGADLQLAWSNYLVVSRAEASLTPDNNHPLQHFELHDLRTLTPQPMWSDTIDDQTESMPWPCALTDMLCQAQGGTTGKISIFDGSFRGTFADPRVPDVDLSQPSTLGVWMVVAPWAEGRSTLVSVSPALSKTGVPWLGALRVRDGRPVITPLMPVPLQITVCWLPDETWVVCTGVRRDGSRWDRSLVLRQSDVDSMVRRSGG